MDSNCYNKQNLHSPNNDKQLSNKANKTIVVENHINKENGKRKCKVNKMFLKKKKIKPALIVSLFKNHEEKKTDKF